jgi:hypothetical protein
MNIVVNEDLKAYIDPLTPEEHEALERSILAEGCRDALVLWGEVLVDGHNRYGICQKHGVPFQTVQNPRFQSLEDVHMWMIDQHLGRRSVSDFQRGVLALRKKEILQERSARALAAAGSSDAETTTSGEALAAALDDRQASDTGSPAPLSSREAIARAARISSGQVVMIEKIQKQAAPEVLAAVKSGTISINAAAALATLPPEDQAAAAQGGVDELKQAAKRVREAKRRARQDTASATGESPPFNAKEVEALKQRVAELTAENDALRRQVASLLARAAP